MIAVPEVELEGIDGIVNLAGESIMGRWTRKRSNEFYLVASKQLKLYYRLLKS